MKKNMVLCTIILVLMILILPQMQYESNATGIKSGIEGIQNQIITSANNGSTGDLGDLNLYGQGDDGDISSLTDIAGTIVGIIKTIGMVVSVIALICIGIKYMLGSVEEKAEYKETLKPYLIGAVLVFTVSLLPEIIYNIMQDIF